MGLINIDYSGKGMGFHKAADFPFEVEEKQAEEEFECEFSRSGQGSGKTDSEEPETFEHTQVAGEPELLDKVMLARQIEVKGDSGIPVKFPAMVMSVPITPCRVTSSKTGRALGSNLSSGWTPQ